MLNRLLSVATAVCIAVSALLVLSSPAQADSTSNAINAAASFAVTTNLIRQSQGLSTLHNTYQGTSNCGAQTLQNYAYYTAIVNAQNDTLAHDPNSPGDLHICGAGAGGQNVGEWYAGANCDNWAYAVQQMTGKFYADPGHAANQENPSWTTEGIGAWCSASGNLYLTANFNNEPS